MKCKWLVPGGPGPCGLTERDLPATVALATQRARTVNLSSTSRGSCSSELTSCPGFWPRLSTRSHFTPSTSASSPAAVAHWNGYFHSFLKRPTTGILFYKPTNSAWAPTSQPQGHTFHIIMAAMDYEALKEQWSDVEERDGVRLSWNVFPSSRMVGFTFQSCMFCDQS